MVAERIYDAQVGVLGSVLISPELAGPVIAQVRAEDFTSGIYRSIFQAISGQFLEGRPVDPVLVKERLAGMDGAGRTLVEIMDLTPTASNVWAYVDKLKEQSALFRLREIGKQLETVLSLEDAQGLVDRANGVFSSRPGVERMSAMQMVEDFMERHGENRHPDYLTWSLPKLDDGTYTEPGDMVILGGYPSAGKTALALRFAWHMARTKRVGFYSLETRPSKLGDRSVAAIAGIEMDAIKGSVLREEDWARLANCAEEIANCTMDLIPGGGMSAQDIQADALAHRYEVIFLDYVQLVKAPKAGNRTEAVTAVSIELHQLAQTHNITVVALSQLSRAKASLSGDELAPTMSSLRESGQLEQDADAVFLLYREKPDDSRSRRVLFVAKNKEGTIGKIYLDFNGRTQTFQESDSTQETARALAGAGRKAKRRTANSDQTSLYRLPDITPVPWEDEYEHTGEEN